MTLGKTIRSFRRQCFETSRTGRSRVGSIARFATLAIPLAAVFALADLPPSLSGLVCSDAMAGNESGTPEIGSWGVDLEARDLSVRPQDDFFRYANGTWLDTFEMPADLAWYGSFTKLWLQSEERVRSIIEDTAAEQHPPGSNEQKIADLYRDYLDQDAADERGLAPLAGDLQRIESITSADELARYMGEVMRRGGSTLFGYWVDQDAKNPDHYLAYFHQGGLGLPDRDWYLEDDNPRFAEARDAYRDYVADMLAIAEVEGTADRARAIVDFETHLAEVHWPREDTRDVEKTYNLMSPAELGDSAPGFAWAAFLEGCGLASQPSFIVGPPSAFEGMAKVLSETPLAVWKDWMRYRLLHDNAALLPRVVDETRFAFESKVITGAEEQRERWKRAVGFVNRSMGEAVGRIYVARHFPESSKQQVEELVDNLLVAMGQRIDGLDWMSADTKKAAHDKLAKFHVKIGYPDTWRDYSALEVVPGDLLGNAFRAGAFEYERNLAKLDAPVDRTEWFMSPQTVNAYYNSGMNEIVFPAGILQPPFFDPMADPAVNYGGIGAVIGHEIGHGFDDQGRKSDGDGVLRDWWTEDDARRFQTRADMLVAQYSGYSPLEGMFVNGELTLGENIGDLGGVEIAFHAYQLSLNGQEPPVLDGYTGAQRFFLGWSQIWQGTARDEAMADLITSDPHSPVEFRVNGPLRNNDVFYEAFEVQRGDGMFLPEDSRARIW